MKYVSARPSPDEFSGRIKVLAGGQDIWDGEIALNIPLGGDWAIRAFGFGRKDDGFLTNPNSPSPVFGVTYDQDPDVGAIDDYGFRLSLAGILSDRLTLFASARYSDFSDPANFWARELGTSLDFEYPRTLDASRNPTLDRDTFGAKIELELDLDAVTITSISGYTTTDSTRVTDVDLTQLWFFNTTRPEAINSYSQEVRFTSNNDGPLQWIAGFYYNKFEEQMNSFLDLGWIIIESDDPFEFLTVPFETRAEDDSNLAAFGNVTYEIGNWELGAGLRVDRWRAREVALDIGHSASRSETEVLPKLSLSRKFDDSGLVYFTYSRGFEPGGFNGIPDGAPQSLARMVR